MAEDLCKTPFYIVIFADVGPYHRPGQTDNAAHYVEYAKEYMNQ